MNQFYKYIIILISLTLPITSLSAANYSSSQRRQTEILTLLRGNEKQLNVLSSRVQYLMNNNAVLVQKIKNLEQSAAAGRQNNSKLEREISTLKQQLSADRKQVQKSLDNVIDKVANETTKAINSAVKSTNKANRSYSKKGKSSPAGNGEFFEYKVQPGATLSAIAKAYGVSVNSIRKANELDNDLIRVGQVLYIPKK